MPDNTDNTADRTVQETHNMGVEYAARYLIDNGIGSQLTDIPGTDLILYDGKTVRVAAMSKETRLTMSEDNLDNLKCDYFIIISNVAIGDENVYIMTTDDTKSVCVNAPRKIDGKDDYFIDKHVYLRYHNNRTIITDGYNTLTKVDYIPSINSRMSEDEKDDIRNRREAAKAAQTSEKESERMSLKAAERAAFRADYERRHGIK